MKLNMGDFAISIKPLASSGENEFRAEDIVKVLEKCGYKLSINTIKRRLYECYKDGLLSRKVPDVMSYYVTPEQIALMIKAHDDKIAEREQTHYMRTKQSGRRIVQPGEKWGGKPGEKITIMGV